MSQSVPGSYTSVIPSSGIIVEIGHVVMSHTTEGSIFVRPRVIGSLVKSYFADDMIVDGTIQGAHLASDSSIGSTTSILIDGHTLIFKDGLFIQYIPKSE